MGSAGSDGPDPTSGGEDTADRDRRPARFEHLFPADSQRQLPHGRTAQIAIQVIPSVVGGLVAQATVQLGIGGLGCVLDVALDT